MTAPVVVYADFESAIDDENRHKPIMLSCLAVSRIPAIDSQLRVFHAPHESEEDLRPSMEYLVQLQESVITYIFDELPLESTSKVEKDFRSTTMCRFCHRKLVNGEIAEIIEGDSLDISPRCDITHMWQMNTPQGIERYASSKPSSTSAPVAPNAISNYRSTRRTIVCQCTFTMDRTMISHSS